jgi:hypothetical protein
MPLAIPKTISHLACYKTRNKKEMSTIWEELKLLGDWGSPSALCV